MYQQASQMYQSGPPPLVFNNVRYDFLPYEQLTVDWMIRYLKQIPNSYFTDVQIIQYVEKIFNEGYNATGQYLVNNHVQSQYIAAGGGYYTPDMAAAMANYQRAYVGYANLQQQLPVLQRRKAEIGSSPQ